MNILHYFLGFPPYRSGGLTKYCFDLMQSQVKDGNNVSALWPGQMKVVKKGVSIKKRDSVKGIDSYEIINPLPVPLDEGIINTLAYMASCDSKIYESFLKEIKPDIVHIHTLMGLHIEFIGVLKKLGIRSVMTTHDYYGICPKVTLYRFGEVCENNESCEKCVQCNIGALSIGKIRFLQSPLYRMLKSTSLISFMRKRHRSTFFLNDILPEIASKYDIDSIALKYSELRHYYTKMIEMIDVIHFNSSVSEQIYKKYICPKKSVVLSISHKNIQDNRRLEYWKPSELLRVVYLAPAKPFKGFIVLKSALDQLWEEGNRNFQLKLFGYVPSRSPYMYIEENGFSQDQLPEIFKEADVVVAPSVWYETFGFTVLEAISYGVPVIVSNHVGAKDIIGEGGIIIEAGSVNGLKTAISSLNIEKLTQLRENVLKTINIKTWADFVVENYQLYEK